MGVGGVACVTRPGANEGVGGNPGRDDEGRDPDTETGEIISDIVPVRESREGNTIFRGGDIYWWHDVVGEAAVLVEVDDHETAKLQELVAKSHGARKAVEAYMLSQYCDCRMES